MKTCWKNLFFALDRGAPFRQRPFLLPRTQASVDVHIAIYDEPYEILRSTIVACRSLTYPHRLYLLDHGRREDVRQLAERYQCGYLPRENNGEWPAATGEFVVVLHAHLIPQPDLIQKALGYFVDPQVAVVQFPQDSGTNRSGSPAVLRRSATAAAGGIAKKSIVDIKESVAFAQMKVRSGRCARFFQPERFSLLRLFARTPPDYPRRTYRFPIRLGAEFDQDGWVWDAEIQDLNTEGARICGMGNPPPPQAEFRFNFPGGSFQCDIKLHWVRRDGDRWEAGVTFHGYHDANMNQLITFLYVHIPRQWNTEGHIRIGGGPKAGLEAGAELIREEERLTG